MNAVTETGVKETRRDRLAWAKRAGVGRISSFAVVAGVLVSYAAFVVFVGAATAVVAAFGIGVDLTDREWRRVGTGAGIAAGVLLFLAYLFGGYVSGRMARRAGLTNGLLVFIGGLVVAGATVGIVQAASGSGEAVDRLRDSLRNFGVPTSGSQWGDVGTVAGTAALAGMLLGAVLGGSLGERWHAKMARAALDTEVRENLGDGATGPKPSVELEGRAVAEARNSQADGERVRALEERLEAMQDRVHVLQASADDNGSGSESEEATIRLSSRPEGSSERRNGQSDSSSDDENLKDLTKAELYQRARASDVEGRSQMTKDELMEAFAENDKD